MEIGVLAPDADWPTVIAVARRVEERGAHRLWLDHGDSLVLGSALTQVVPQLGVGVVAPSLRDRPPVLLARQLTALQLVSSRGVAVIVRDVGEQSSLLAALRAPYRPALAVERLPNFYRRVSIDEVNDGDGAAAFVGINELSSLRRLEECGLGAAVLSFEAFDSL